MLQLLHPCDTEHRHIVVAMRRLASVVLLAACSQPALTFVPEKLPDATVGQPYHVVLEVSGGKTPVGNISAAPMPPGLVLTYRQKYDDTASIDGTPTEAGRTSITVEAWCYGTNRSGQSGKRVYELVVH
jgi:hypothetical protein